MEQRVKAYIRQLHMLEEGDCVIAGISGGPDSVYLLYLLSELREEMALKVVAVHVNHGLRGADADRDENYVKELCEKWEIPVEVEHVDVKAFARERGLSEEEAGREVRRAAYEKAVKKYSNTKRQDMKIKIALAHHGDDNAETLIYRMARGTGMRGMAGIRPIAGDVIHPLLCVRKQELVERLEELGIQYCVDDTNREDIYARNRIRNQVLPVLEREVNTKTVEHMGRLAWEMDMLRGYIDRKVDEAYRACVTKQSGDQMVAIPKLLEVDEELRGYLVRRVIAEAAGRERDIEASHVEAVLGLAMMQSGRKISLPYGLWAVKSQEMIRIGSEIVTMSSGNLGRITTKVLECDQIPDAFEVQTYTKWFDYDIIQNSLSLRTRQAGDIIQIDREGHHKKLKEFFIHEKIPAEVRDQVPLVAEGQEILWVIGYRQSKKYQVTEHTRRILEITYEE